MKNKNAVIGTLAGGIAGAVYFNIGESGVPKNSNATYLNPILTDVLAWGFGGLMIWKGFEYDDPLICFVGAAVVSIHISQFASHKTITNRILK